MKITVLCDIESCSVSESDSHFSGTYCLNRQGNECTHRLDDGSNMHA
jgi:hypothetical protein